MLQHLRMTIIITLIIAGSVISHAHASGNSILLVKSSDKPIYNRLVDRFTDTILHSGIDNNDLSIITYDKIGEYLENNNGNTNLSLILTVGTIATQKTFEAEPSVNVLSSLVPKSTYNQLLRKHGLAEKGKGKYAAIYIDQPVERQLRFIRKLLPGKNKLGVLLGPSSKNDLSELNHFSRKFGFNMTNATLEEGSYLPTPARNVFKKSQFMLARPDSYIYTPQHSKWLLYTSFKFRIPFIAYSEAFVKAGALAAMHSTPEEVGQQLAELTIEFFNNGNRKLSGSVYPKYYKISINPSIARSLRIPVPDLSAYENRIDGEAR